MGATAADPLSDWLADLARLPEVSFQSPERLWFGAPLLVVLLLVPLARRARAGPAAAPFLLRALLLLALLAVLLEPVVPETRTQTGRLVVLADVSPSVGDAGRRDVERYLEASPAPFDLLPFGAEPHALQDHARLEPDPRDATDLAAALRRAAVHAPASPRRVVVLSDGRATVPGAGDAAMRLRADGAEVFAVAVPADDPATPPELAVRGLDLPPVEERRAPFPLTVEVEASAATRATVTLFVDGEARRVEDVALQAGASPVSFSELKLEPGRHLVQALVASDRTPEDNVMGAMVEVPGIPRVLLLAKDERKALLAQALAVQGLFADVKPAADDHAFSQYDAVVLLPDAPVADLERHAAALAEFVGRRGGGLLALGGARGKGLARLYGTPVAFLLPLEVEPKPEEPEPSPPEPEADEKPRIEIVEEEKEAYPITLCLVVDRSGSMIGYKLRQAQLAAIAAARTLTKEDRLAVLAFADDVELVLAPRTAGDVEGIARAVGGLRAEGHTAMFHGLAAAYEVMRREETPIRHVVLVSDGRPTDSGPWRDLVTKMSSEKITLSCVGIGMDLDTHLLGQLSKWGRGQIWHARPDQIPQVITQDTLRVVKARGRRGEDAERARPDEEEPPEERPPERPPEPRPEPPPPPAAVAIVAERGAPREMLKGLEDPELPRVAAVEEGKPRFASWVAARAGADGPPLLAYWRIGLGTAAALAIDVEAPELAELREHPEFGRLMAQLVRSVLPDTRAEPFVLDHRVEDSVLKLRVRGEDGLARTDLPVGVRTEGADLEIRRRADGYEATLPSRREATRVTVRLGPADAPLLERSLVVPPSSNPELARTGADRAALLRLVGDRARLDAPRGQVLAVPSRTFVRPRPCRLPFLLIAAILLPLDAWTRRRARGRALRA